MNERTKAALEESIEKWRQIERGEMWDEGSHNCALCCEFFQNCCYECPVREHTGKANCDGTPFMEWANSIEVSPAIADTPRLRKIARAERKFLESLKEETT